MGLDSSPLDASGEERERGEARARGPASDTGPEMNTTTASFTLSPGDTLRCADGSELGSVRSVRGGYFEVELPDHDRFWLSSAYVASARDGSATLTLTGEGVEEHRLLKPGLETIDRSLAGTGDAAQTSLEALQMRERIEQELLAQRGTIDTGLSDR